MKPQLKLQTLSDFKKKTFRRSLLAWYDDHARDLPWRLNRDPYRVWLSEIMLQQTRVAAVIEHYHEFLRRFPAIEKLAAAREASVLAAWSGLGYYRRARLLHAAAKVIVREHGGKFPNTMERLRELAGIGRYTAAAIASIAFGEAVAAVDGNVERVLQRLMGKKLAVRELWRVADDVLDKSRPGDFNQAMMELGATVCRPRAPACLTCPMVDLCATRGPLAMTVQPALQKKREIHYALHCREGEVFLVQRPLDASLMPGMWELPEKLATDDDADLLFTLRHSITVTDYTARIWSVVTPSPRRGKWIPLARLQLMPLTGLVRKILRKAECMEEMSAYSNHLPTTPYQAESSKMKPVRRPEYGLVAKHPEKAKRRTTDGGNNRGHQSPRV